MHALLYGYQETEDLILDLDSATDRKLARSLKTNPGKQITLQWSPGLEDIDFGTDLLKLADSNKVRKLSPSRLDQLMVSPLAWFLAWINIEPKEWAPEEPGPLILGSLAHGVYENLFKAATPTPTADAITTNVPELLEQELKRYAPYMLAQKWAIERHKLVDDITRSAIEWGDTLSRLGASIVGNEIWLKGEYSGIAIHGQADCIFKLPNGQLVVVDYKKASHGPREKQMSKGYDSQVSLYREMLKSGLPEPHQDLDASNTEVLYYMMNSRKIISEKPLHGSANVPGWITIHADVAVNAMQLIKERVAQIRQGKVMLNQTSDEDFFTSEACLKPYALDRSPLIRLFMKPDAGDAS
jgi:RecB family exonuclease